MPSIRCQHFVVEHCRSPAQVHACSHLHTVLEISSCYAQPFPYTLYNPSVLWATWQPMSPLLSVLSPVPLWNIRWHIRTQRKQLCLLSSQLVKIWTRKAWICWVPHVKLGDVSYLNPPTYPLTYPHTPVAQFCPCEAHLGERAALTMTTQPST